MKLIPFSTPMVQAILNTKPGVWPAEPIDKTKPYKWQTRQPVNTLCKGRETGFEVNLTGASIRFFNKENPYLRSKSSPYRVGDVLYVRETFFEVPGCGYLYLADPRYYGGGKGDFSWNWKPSIHMPREAARLFLEVKNVRVERIQKITEKDAKAEGVFPISCLDLQQIPNSLIEPGGMYGKGVISFHSFKAAFYKTWELLYAKRDYPWEDNPWVWVIEFERIEETNKWR